MSLLHILRYSTSTSGVPLISGLWVIQGLDTCYVHESRLVTSSALLSRKWQLIVCDSYFSSIVIMAIFSIVTEMKRDIGRKSGFCVPTSTHQPPPLEKTVVNIFTSDKGGGKCVCPRLSVCLSVCLWARLHKTRGWIWMKFCMSTDVGTWTNRLIFEPDPDHSPDPGAGFTLDFWILARYLKISRSYGQILKFNWSIATGAWTNLLCFKLDPDHSPDPGTGFTPDFWILAGYLDKLWADFDEILWVDNTGAWTNWISFEPDSDHSPD